MTVRHVLLAILAPAMFVVAGCGGDSSYVLRMRVPDAGGLRADQDVKIDGVRAGTVTGVTVDKTDHAIVTMRLQPGAVPVGAAATGRIRSVSVLGEKYVDLSPDRGGRAMPSGAWLTPTKQSAPVELDDILNTLDAPTRERLRILLVEGGVGLTGRGDDVRELLRVLPRGMDQVGRLINDASVDNRALERVVDAGDRVIGTLAARRRDLAAAITSAGAAFSTTAERRADLGRSVAAAPATLRQLRTSLVRVQRTAAALQPAADRVTTAAGPLEQTLRALPGFAASAVPTLRAARGAAPDLSRLALAATPTVRHLEPVSAKAASALEHAYPLVRDLDRGLANDALYFLQTWARVTQRADGLGHLFGAQIILGEDTVRQIVDRVASNLTTSTSKRSPAPKHLPVPEPSTSVPAPAKSPVQTVKNTVCKALGQVTGALGGIVGKLADPKTGSHPSPPRTCNQAAGAGPSDPPTQHPNPVSGAVDRLTGGDPRNSDTAVSALVDYLFGS